MSSNSASSMTVPEAAGIFGRATSAAGARRCARRAKAKSSDEGTAEFRPVVHRRFAIGPEYGLEVGMSAGLVVREQVLPQGQESVERDGISSASVRRSRGALPLARALRG
jgi:hypothetical protein